MSGLFEGIGSSIGGVIGGGASGVVQGLPGGIAGGIAGGAAGAGIGAAAGASVGAVGGLGVGDVATIPAGAGIGAIGGGFVGSAAGAGAGFAPGFSQGYGEGYGPGAAVGGGYGQGLDQTWLGQKLNAMVKGHEQADEENQQDPNVCSGKCGPPYKLPSNISDKRAKHILDGDKTGGGHRAGTGILGNTEFPADWSDQKILDNVSDVASNPDSVRPDKFGINTIGQGARDGVDIETISNPNGNVITGYPTNTPRNP